MAGSSGYVDRYALIDPTGSADAYTLGAISRYGPTFMVPLTSAGAVQTVTLGGTAGVLVVGVRNGNFYFFDSSMVTLTVRPGTSVPSSAELLTVSV
jgi:hypothetical protein